MENSNILIISNAAMMKADSNGRTISRLLDFVPKNNKYQFCVYGIPDNNECEDYYKITNEMALKSFLKREKINKSKEESENFIIKTNTKYKKTPFKMLLRDFVWNHGKWNNDNLNDWIEKINPKFLFVVAADNCYLLDLARHISNERNLPVVLYSTEEYPFKNYNYITGTKSLIYKLFLHKLRKAYKKIEKNIAFGVFNSLSLTEAYQNKYKYKCHTIFQYSNIDWVEKSIIDNNLKISYLGNLGLNRHKALIDVATTLRSIAPGTNIGIYGKATNTIIEEFNTIENINFNGFVSYEKVVNIIHSSTLLLHVEYNDEFYNRDLKYAFSTKITDSVCSGTPLLIYASNELEETKFLRKQKCAFVASTIEELKIVLKQALFDEIKRKEILINAFRVRKDYFINDGKFNNIIEEYINESNSN